MRRLKFLIALWAFALGVALSYKPPQMDSVPTITGQATPVIQHWPDGDVVLSGWGSETVLWRAETPMGHIVMRSNIVHPVVMEGNVFVCATVSEKEPK